MNQKKVGILEDAFPCLFCGYCRDGCVVFRYYGFEPFLVPVMRFFSASQVKYKSLTFSDDLLNNLYLCTTCGFCKEVCPYEVNFPSLVEKTRFELRTKGLEAPRAFEVIASAIKEEENPYGRSKRERETWASELNLAPLEETDTILFVGCSSSYETTRIAISASKILQHAGVKFGILGEEEPCCGGILMRTGFLDQAKEQAKKVSNVLKGIKEVIVLCPLCYKTFKIDYPQIVGKLPFKITHITEYMDNLIMEKKLKLSNVNLKTTYHDPCELGRHCGIYDAPRNVLKAIPGLELVEMYPTKHLSLCCGAGGGVRTAFPGLAIDMARAKIKLASETGAEAIVTACPQCLINLKDAARKENADLEIYDITEILAKSIK